jgi:hypothetical protein
MYSKKSTFENKFQYWDVYTPRILICADWYLFTDIWGQSFGLSIKGQAVQE